MSVDNKERTLEDEVSYCSVGAIDLRCAILAVVYPKKIFELGDEDAPEFGKIPGIGKLLDRHSTLICCNYRQQQGWTQNEDGEEEILGKYSVGKIHEHMDKFILSHWKLRHHLCLSGFQKSDRIGFEEKNRKAIDQLLELVETDTEIHAKYLILLENEKQVLRKKSQRSCGKNSRSCF